MTRSITVERKEGHPGVWLAKHGRTVLAGICQPTLDVTLGRPLTTQAVIEAVQEVSPGYGATASTPVTFK